MGWDDQDLSDAGATERRVKQRFLSGSELAAIGHGFHEALKAASAYLGATSPNPAVGCTLLDETGKILITAAHHRAGSLHAEALALAQAREQGVLEQARTALVTLEPCNHTGRTPPCSEALAQTAIENIWIGVSDPNPVAGGGAARLRQGGKNVIHLADIPALRPYYHDCVALLAPFNKRITQGKAWVSVKQAVNVNGSMIPPAGSTTFTDAASLELAHRLRRATDAIVTGIGTVLADQPQLTVRRVPDHEQRGPRFLVICDRQGRLPSAYRDLMVSRGFHVLVSRDVRDVPHMLAEHGVNWALIEAGPGLLGEIEHLDLWDDWLTIQQQAAGPDRRLLRSKGPTPLHLILGDEITLERETPFCFEGMR